MISLKLLRSKDLGMSYDKNMLCTVSVYLSNWHDTSLIEKTFIIAYHQIIDSKLSSHVYVLVWEVNILAAMYNSLTFCMYSVVTDRLSSSIKTISTRTI